MSEATERELDWATGRELERKDAEIAWFRSSIVSLLTLAEADNSPLTIQQVATICRHALNKFEAHHDASAMKHRRDARVKAQGT